MREKEEIMKKVVSAQYIPKEAIELLVDIRDQLTELAKHVYVKVAEEENKDEK